MAFTKSEKSAMMAQYKEWLDKSSALFMVQYSAMNMKTIDDIRAKIRDAGGEAHVVKNTLISRVLSDEEYAAAGDDLTGTTLVGFAFNDPAALAKAVSEIAKNDNFTIKGGYLEKNLVSVAEVKTLASLPSLPVMRAKLLGTIMAPATQLVRVVAEPGRQVAAVVQAHLDQG